jgi:hypothetical protein
MFSRKMFKVAIVVIVQLALSVVAPIFGRDRIPKHSPEDFPMPVLSDQERNEAEKALRAISETYMPKGFRGAVVVDAKVIDQLPPDVFGQVAWIVSPERIWIGKDQISGTTLRILSKPSEPGGVQLCVGRSYRILAIDIFVLESQRLPKNTFYTWRGAIIPRP